MDGRTGLLEMSLRADFALTHGDKANAFGNISFAASARNFQGIRPALLSATLSRSQTPIDTLIFATWSESSCSQPEA
ncbi:hypothetical protein GOB48_33325 [Sinorhizobium meliloti]|nr:hypothetical protein [Sinorhizobium meliloti]